MSRLVVSDQAEADLRSITAYIAEKSGKLRAAKAAARIRKTIDNLALMPGIGRRRHYLDPASRVFPVPPWLIVYEHFSQDDGVRILRIIDGRRDLDYLFAMNSTVHFPP